jgi:hypothetical protein
MAQAVDNLTTPARRSFPVCSGDGIQTQATHGSPDDARQHAPPRCARSRCALPQAVFSADDYPDEVPVPSFQARMKCRKCGAKGRQIDIRPNWKEQPSRPTMLHHDEPH